MIVFIESESFSKQTDEYWTQEHLSALKDILTVRPDAGAVIPKGKGLRKIRVSMPGRGKRGGGRVIYYWKVNRDTILLLRMYTKNRKTDLSPTELNELIRERDEIIGK